MFSQKISSTTPFDWSNNTALVFIPFHRQISFHRETEKRKQKKKDTFDEIGCREAEI